MIGLDQDSNTLLPQLHPLPIMGLRYRQNLDFTRPFALAPRGTKCVLEMVEHLAIGLNLLFYLKIHPSW